MIVAILLVMLVALATGQWGPRQLAVGALMLALALATGLFLWQVHSPTDGYRMPWIQVRGDQVRGNQVRDVPAMEACA